MSQKGKRKYVPLQTKLEAIKRLDKGETIKKLATEYGVGEVTVGDWRRNRNKIEQYCTQNNCIENPSRKSMKRAEYEKTSEALFRWFSQQREKGSPISGPMLQEKAVFFRNEFKEGEAEFTASVGWLDRWKKRYGVRQLNICGEKLSADTNAAIAFQERLKTLIENEELTLDQLYNCDETGLNYKMLPAKTLASREEATVFGYKKNKDRLTILACANASGKHKMKLVVVGKSATPRAFKNVSMNALPVSYRNQKSAWMDREIFKNWFHEQFVPQTDKFLRENNKPRKAILLLDNAPSHPDEEELRSGDIRALYLPPNVTSILQPMDQGVLENLKRRYRRHLLQSLLQSVEYEKQTITDFLKGINIKDVIYWIAESWDEVKSETIAKSWRKLQPEVEITGTRIEEREDNLTTLVQKLPGWENCDDTVVNEWLNSDEQFEVTDSEIVRMVVENVEEMSDEEVAEVQPQKNISHSEGTIALETALRYIEQQEEATPTDVLLLKRWRDIAAKKRYQVGKQSTLDDFFKSK